MALRLCAFAEESPPSCRRRLYDAPTTTAPRAIPRLTGSHISIHQPSALSHYLDLALRARTTGSASHAPLLENGSGAESPSIRRGLALAPRRPCRPGVQTPPSWRRSPGSPALGLLNLRLAPEGLEGLAQRTTFAAVWRLLGPLKRRPGCGHGGSARRAPEAFRLPEGRSEDLSLRQWLFHR